MSNKDAKPVNEAFPEPSKAEIINARADGVLDAIKESTKDAYKAGANETTGNPDLAPQRIVMDKEVFTIQHLVDGGVDALNEAIDPKKPNPLSEGKIAGLLEVERSGKNRTDVVRALCVRLGVKSPREVTDAGPAWTQDTTPVSKV